MVEDDKAVRDLTVNALTYSVNREVKGFENGNRAWRFLEQGGRADIVISDVDMPVMNGLELMTRVKQQFPDIVFIVMSGGGAYETKARLGGAEAFLAKPFEINDLFNIVRTFVVEG